MVSVALFFETLQALLTLIFMGWLVTPVMHATFWMWFKMRGHSFYTLKRAPSMSVGVLLEIIPGVSIIPAFTFNVLRAALDTRFKPERSEVITEQVAQKTTRQRERV